MGETSKNGITEDFDISLLELDLSLDKTIKGYTGTESCKWQSPLPTLGTGSGPRVLLMPPEPCSFAVVGWSCEQDARTALLSEFGYRLEAVLSDSFWVFSVSWPLRSVGGLLDFSLDEPNPISCSTMHLSPNYSTPFLAYTLLCPDLTGTLHPGAGTLSTDLQPLRWLLL